MKVKTIKRYQTIFTILLVAGLILFNNILAHTSGTTYSLTISKLGAGSGTVISDPAGVVAVQFALQISTSLSLSLLQQLLIPNSLVGAVVVALARVLVW